MSETDFIELRLFCQAHIILYTKQEEQDGTSSTLVNKDHFLNICVGLTYFTSSPSLSDAWQRGRGQKWIGYSTVKTIKNYVFVVYGRHSESKNVVLVSGSTSTEVCIIYVATEREAKKSITLVLKNYYV